MKKIILVLIIVMGTFFSGCKEKNDATNKNKNVEVVLNGVGHKYIAGKISTKSDKYYYNVEISIVNNNDDVDYHIDGHSYRLVSKQERQTFEYEREYSISDPIVYAYSNRTISIRYFIGEFSRESYYTSFIKEKTFELYFIDSKLVTVNVEISE